MFLESIQYTLVHCKSRHYTDICGHKGWVERRRRHHCRPVSSWSLQGLPPTRTKQSEERVPHNSKALDSSQKTTHNDKKRQQKLARTTIAKAHSGSFSFSSVICRYWYVHLPLLPCCCFTVTPLILRASHFCIGRHRRLLRGKSATKI